MSCGIYKFTSKTTGLSYIGQSIDIERRYNEHKRTTNKDYSFYNAIKEHGWDDFIFEIIEYCNQEQLNEREKYWISYYDTYYHGYNETLGGEGGPASGKKKPVAQYDLEGNFIAAYESELDAERKLGFKSKSSNISRVCSGEAYKSKGFQWRFITNDIDYKSNIGSCPQKARYSNKTNKIAQCDIETHNIIQIFNSISEASRKTGINRQNISSVCNNRNKSASGYYWFKI